MAEVWVRFNTENEADQERIRFMTNGWRYRHVIWEIDQYLRSRLKYQELSGEEYEALQAARDRLWQLVNEEGLDIL